MYESTVRIWCLIAFVACQADKPTPHVLARSDAASAVIAIDAAAPPPIKREVPEHLASAPKWIGRRLMTGAVNAITEHFTFTLQRDGGQALLTIEKRHATNVSGGDKLMPEKVDEWKLISTEQFIGTFEEHGDVVTIALKGLGGGDKRDFRCKKTTIPAAGANAARARSPGYRECGDTGRWVPAATTQVDVIRCVPFEEKGSDEWARLAFAAAPGIEWLHVNDDCVIQGGGWRLVPPDGGIGRLRKKR